MITTELHPLHLPLKGTRDYIAGADIVPALLAFSGPLERVSFHFHRMARQALAAGLVDASEVAELRQRGALVALMTGRAADGAVRHLAVTAREDGGPLPRIAFNEEAIAAGAIFGARRVLHADRTAGSFTERAVALHKALLNRVVGPSMSPWIFSRLDLAQTPVDPSALSLEFDRAIGTQVFRSRLAGDGRPLGHLTFTRSTP